MTTQPISPETEAMALTRGRDILTRKAIEGRAKVEALAAHDAILCDLILSIVGPLESVKGVQS